MPLSAGPIHGHVRTGPQPYPQAFPPYGYGQFRPGLGRHDYNRGRRFAGAPLIYPFGGYGAGSTVVEPSVVTQYAEPPLQGYYGYYGAPAPAPCVASVIIQIGPMAGGAGRLLPPVVQGGSGGCAVPQVVTYTRADAPPRVIDGIGPAPRGKRKHALRTRY